MSELKSFMDNFACPNQLSYIDIDVGNRLSKVIYATGIEDWIVGKKGL